MVEPLQHMLAGLRRVLHLAAPLPPGGGGTDASNYMHLATGGRATCGRAKYIAHSLCAGQATCWGCWPEMSRHTLSCRMDAGVHMRCYACQPQKG